MSHQTRVDLTACAAGLLCVLLLALAYDPPATWATLQAVGIFAIGLARAVLIGLLAVPSAIAAFFGGL